MRRYIAFTTILFSTLVTLAAKANSPSNTLSGDVRLLSQYVENGLSQSDKTPALQAEFLFNLGPQFRLGLWGSNTNYQDSEDRFNLRIKADIKVDISSQAHLLLCFNQSQYYNGGDRNGSMFGVHLNLQKARILYDSYSNWEGSKKRSLRYALGHNMDVGGSWKWDNELGYNSPTLSSIKPYFDGKTGLGSNFGAIFLEGAITGTSESSQFNGAGDFAFILSASKEL